MCRKVYPAGQKRNEINAYNKPTSPSSKGKYHGAWGTATLEGDLEGN